MSDRDLVIALFLSVVAIALALVGQWLRLDHPAVTSGRPVVGRTAEDVEGGSDPRFRHIHKATEAELLARARSLAWARFDRLFEGVTWPRGLKYLVISPLPGDLPKTVLEEGPPWHVVLDRAGEVHVVDRLRRGRPGAPEGLPPAFAARALHVALPHAHEFGEVRAARWAELSEWLLRRLDLEPAARLLAGEVTGAEVPAPPPGIPREVLLGSRESPR